MKTFETHWAEKLTSNPPLLTCTDLKIPVEEFRRHLRLAYQQGARDQAENGATAPARTTCENPLACALRELFGSGQ